MKLRVRVGVAMVLAALLVGASSATAAAAPNDAKPRGVKTATDMKFVPVVGVVESGEQHIISLANGQEVELSREQFRLWSETEYGRKVLAGSANGDISASNVLTGTCGSQYLYIDGKGLLTLQVDTGFDLIAPVISSVTYVSVNDEGGASERRYKTEFDDGDWSTSELLGGMTEGSAFAQINTSKSYAVLITGGFCYALGASDTAWIYY